MDPDTLRALLLVVEHGTIAAAADAVGTSPQAVSARIRAAERRLGVELLHRSTHGVRPTEAGRLVAGWGADVVAALDEFDARIGSLAAEPVRPLRIAASLTNAEHLAPQWLVAAARDADAHEVALAAMNSTEVVAAVRSGAVDLGFIETVDVPTDLGTATIARDELVVVVAPDHPWAGRTVDLDTLARTALVARETGSGTRTTYERSCVEHGVGMPATPAMTASTNAGVRSAVAAGVGPAVLSTLAVRDAVALGRLVQVPVPGVRITRPLSAVWRGSGPPDGAVARVLRAARSA